MSKLSEQVSAMTPEELDLSDWVVVLSVLLQAKERFKSEGLGNQSWLDGAIGIAEGRINKELITIPISLLGPVPK